MLYVFVEGIDDEAFFDKIYEYKLQNRHFIKYSKMKADKVNGFLKSINSMNNSDYMFIGDADGNSLETKKEKLLKAFHCLSEEKTFIVQYEIESWYYAGISKDECKKLKLKKFKYYTDNITKEDFNKYLYKESERKPVMTQILAMYHIDLAICRNKSISIFDKVDLSKIYDETVYTYLEDSVSMCD